MTAQIISLAERRPAPTPAPSRDEWNHPSSDERAKTRVLLHRIAINLGLPLKPEDYGFLHRYGHLAP